MWAGNTNTCFITEILPMFLHSGILHPKSTVIKSKGPSPAKKEVNVTDLKLFFFVGSIITKVHVAWAHAPPKRRIFHHPITDCDECGYYYAKNGGFAVDCLDSDDIGSMRRNGRSKKKGPARAYSRCTCSLPLICDVLGCFCVHRTNSFEIKNS